MLLIDGSQGEGGGQILRTALGLSLVTGTAFRIEKIRAGRAKPGLLRQHLTAVNAATVIGDALVDGAELGSPVAVLDGPVSILRWRHRVRSRTSVMLLDRTAPSADAAVDAVIADRARSLRDSLELIPPPPAGIEVLAYLGRR